jgi:hypothetical protein
VWASEEHPESDHPEIRSARSSQVPERDGSNTADIEETQRGNAIEIEQAVPPPDVGGTEATSTEENAQEVKDQ